MPSAFIRRVKNYIFQEKLFEKGDGIIIGVSGGPDSVALCRVLHAIRTNYDLKLKIVHINYGLRGADSDKDEMLVRKLADQLGLPLRIVRYPNKQTSEEQLRNFRYAEFEKERMKEGFDWIAVAHHQDDQVETFFLNLLRGSGLKGLGGMAPQRDRIIRPLLSRRREEIVAFLKEINQKYRIDKSNREIKYLRNRIRNKLIPLLEREYNPATRERIFSLTETFRIDSTMVEEIGKKAYNTYIREIDGRIVLSEKDAQNMSRASLSWIFRRAMANLGGLSDLSLAQFREFEKIVKSGKSKEKIMRWKGVIISKKGSNIVFIGRKRYYN